MRPLSVSIPIKHRNPQLTAETQYEIKCESWGSHPPPVMTWWLDGREEKGAAIEVRLLFNFLNKFLMVQSYLRMAEYISLSYA